MYILMYVQIVRGNYDRCGRKKKKYIKKLNLAELAQLLGLLCIFQLHWDPLAARLAPEPTEHPPTAAPKERGPSLPRAHLCVDQLCHDMVVTMSPVAAGYSSSLS